MLVHLVIHVFSHQPLLSIHLKVCYILAQVFSEIYTLRVLTVQSAQEQLSVAAVSSTLPGPNLPSSE